MILALIGSLFSENIVTTAMAPNLKGSFRPIILYHRSADMVLLQSGVARPVLRFAFLSELAPETLSTSALSIKLVSPHPWKEFLA